MSLDDDDDDDDNAPDASKGWPSCLNHNLGHAVAAGWRGEGRRQQGDKEEQRRRTEEILTSAQRAKEGEKGKRRERSKRGP